jgi:subtilisin-like proprotein convertase family protein
MLSLEAAEVGVCLPCPNLGGLQISVFAPEVVFV